METEEILAWERKWRVLAAGAASLAAIAPIVALFPVAGITAPKHDNDLLDLYRINGHRSSLLTSTIVSAIGLIAASVVLYYLYRAVRARKPDPVSPAIGALSIVGPILAAVTTIVAGYFQVKGSHTFVSSMPRRNAPQTLQFLSTASQQQIATATHYIKDASQFQVAGYVGPAGLLVFAFALVLVSLNAMRVGLVTRLIGIVGIVLAVAQVFPLFPPYVLQLFFFGALTLFFLGRWPNGLPPAWETGTAQPWPSRQAMAEQRVRQRRGDPEPEPESEPEQEEERVPAGVDAALGRPQHPSSKKRKRKRRR